MLSLDNISIEKLSVHFTGNKSRDEGVILSKAMQKPFSPEEEQALWKFFLTPFKNVSEFYRFSHSSDVSLNEVRKFATEIFETPSRLHLVSEKLAKLLYSCSIHSKIAGGELYIAYLSNCVWKEQEVNAVGIFKSETKDTFIQAAEEKGLYQLRFQAGTNIHKLDKACLILETGGEEEYQVCIADNMGKSAEAVYWKDNFLNLEPCADAFHHTKNFMSVCKDFVAGHLATDFEVSPTDKIGYMNKSVDYFKKHETFNEDEFTKEVFEDKEVIRSFRQFKEEYQDTKQVELESEFEISTPAVKKQARIFKSVLKLDKNFHIYIHGRQDFIEKGIEKDGRKYYKIYYSEES